MDDQQTKEIKAGLKEGQQYYPASRTIQSEWPKMATRGNGKGKKPTSQVCQNQAEYDEFMKGGVSDKSPDED